jgi:gamma-glutamylcyclotransferase (GGCT)/AIG2-like uncharacterized protein YtfP
MPKLETQSVKKNVFTYGSLMFAPVWLSVCSQAYPTVQATLQGYRRYSVLNETYPALVAENGARVVGLVYKDVSLEDCLKLNQFEGSEYQCLSANVESLEGPIQVVFYEFVALNRLLKQDWSVTDFEEKGLPTFLARHVGDFLATGARPLSPPH